MPDPSTSSKTATDSIAEEFGANDWLIEEMYEQYLADPRSVDPSWASYFETHDLGAGSNGSGGNRTAPARSSSSRSRTAGAPATPAPKATPTVAPQQQPSPAPAP
ncbi:MAG: hypothetical protein QM650_07870, partial [Microlunatus sp.]